jgi:RNA methyltransferase, TrmH family
VVIESKRNPRFLALSKLIHSPRERREKGLCVLEGEHLVAQYAQKYEKVAVVICGVGTKSTFLADETLELTEPLLAALSELNTAQNQIAIAPVPTLEQQRATARACVPAGARPCVLALDDVQDPGNVGTLLRTAAAVGIDEVWMSSGCAAPWSQKVLRASQGAQFELVVRDGVDLAQEVAQFSGNVVVSALQGAQSLFSTDIPVKPTLFIVGNEGAGVSAALTALATTKVRIPMRDGVESLNVAAATAVVLYEWARQWAHLKT